MALDNRNKKYAADPFSSDDFVGMGYGFYDDESDVFSEISDEAEAFEDKKNTINPDSANQDVHGFDVDVSALFEEEITDDCDVVILSEEATSSEIDSLAVENVEDYQMTEPDSLMGDESEKTAYIELVDDKVVTVIQDLEAENEIEGPCEEGDSECEAVGMIAFVPKSVSIQGQLKRVYDENPGPESDANLIFGIDSNVEVPKEQKPGKKRTKYSFFENKTLRKVLAAVAIFAIILSSVGYYSAFIESADKIAASAVSYLFSNNGSRRTVLGGDVSLLGAERDDQIFMSCSSVEEDINILITDYLGTNVTGTKFEFNVTNPENETVKYTDDNADGEVTIDGLKAGLYTVEMLKAKGYSVPDVMTVDVQPKVEYVKIENIGDKIVDQNQVDLSEDDMQYGGRDPVEPTPAPTPTNKDTLEYVESSVKEVEVEKTRTVTKFKGRVDSSTGRLYFANGTLSNVIPQIDSEGYLTGEYSLLNEKYTLTVIAGKGGSASASATTAAAYTEIVLTAVPSEGYVFAGWSCPNGDNPFTDPSAAKTVFLMPSCNTTVTASFAPSETSNKEYSLTVLAGVGGKASASKTSVAAGASVSVTAVPDGGYVFSGWTSSGGGSFADPSGTSTTFIMPASNVTISATFAVDSTGGATGGDINLFETDSSGKYVYDIAASSVTETYKEVETKYYGWQTIKGKTYYYDKNGDKAYGTQVIQGVTYIFGADGALSKGDTVLGIDVSTWQGSINWSAVAASGVKYAIIRIGFRGYGTGKIVEDNRFLENIKGAKAAGLKVGVYFYSQAINAAEAVEEASATLELLRGYHVDYPIIIDMEDAGSSSARTVGLSRAELTKITVAFCETVRNSGYSAMVYANKYWLECKLDTSQFGSYYIWLAHYTGGSASSYRGRYEMWQYTSVGKVNGISGNVDMNYSYMG